MSLCNSFDRNGCTPLLHTLRLKVLVGLVTDSTAAPAKRLRILQDPNKRSFHFCIVNLVIGTLYCVKGNYEFGIARIIKSMEPESKKLEADTWFYAKRCFLALLEGVAKHMISLKVSVPAYYCAAVMRVAACQDDAKSHRDFLQ